MQTNLLWTGREYYSLENCLVNTTPKGSEIVSTIIGKYNEKIYRVAYQIKTNQNWDTVYFEITTRHSDQTQQFRFESDEKGNWIMNGKQAAEFQDCTDIDIPLTPFTNSLPINRLQLKPGENQNVQVIYFDVLERQIKSVRQKYTRLSATEYLYENVPNDFEAKIIVDEHGFVTDYPGLFVRTAALKSNYSWPG